MSDKIQISEIYKLLDNPDTTPNDIKQYFIKDEKDSMPFKPAIILNPEKVDFGDDEAALFMGHFNKWGKSYRKRKFERQIEKGWEGLICLEEGDSWTQYPILLDDIVDNMFPHFAVDSLGQAGDLLADMVKSKELTKRYDPDIHDFVFLSGGGNDLFGESRLEIYLNDYESKKAAEDHLNDKFLPFLNKAINNYDLLIGGLIKKSANVKIYIHTYAYAFPNSEKWLGKPMAKKGIVNQDFQHEIMKVIVNKFYTAMKALEQKYSQNVTLVDLRELLPSKDKHWSDELHPSNLGFEIITDEIISQIKR